MEFGPDATREDHMTWCKARALEYLPGDPNQAFMSLASDLGKHPETVNHAGIELGMMLLLGGHLSDAHKMREFIEGFR